DFNLGAIAVEGAAVEPAALVEKAHDGARFGINTAHVTSINPMVARAQPLDATRADHDAVFRHRGILAD
ncbi:MAG: hypothetical protein WA766_12370, partial [Candidatus Acidiferrales bacterium]